MSFRIKKRLCGLLIIVLLIFVFIPVIFPNKKQPEGQLISRQEVVTLNKLLMRIEEDQGHNNKIHDLLLSMVDNWQQDNISYDNWKEWWQKISSIYGIDDVKIEGEFEKRYNNFSFLLKEDWYKSFDLILTRADREGKIKWINLLILGNHLNVTDIEGIPIAENEVYTNQGRWISNIGKEDLLFQKQALYLTYNDEIWAVNEEEKESELSNVWIVDSAGEKLTYFYKNYYVTTDNLTNQNNMKEVVADIVFKGGNIEHIDRKEERVGGKVIKLSDTGVELENGTYYEFDENVQLYRLFGRLETVGKKEIRLGYNFTDFVVEGKKIIACLVIKDEIMEYIRVLIKNSDFSRYYHNEIIASCDVDMEVKMGEEIEVIPANERFVISYDDMEMERIYMTPKVLTGKIYFDSFARNNGGQGYHGRFEVEKREEGILLINEVLLEEYLYAVIPSEMPATYPMEALKAQAISARTYAYERLVNPGLAAYGANLDDSTSYQVYNNIIENSNTTKAVKETMGKLLFYEDSPASTYYYSTSCGAGANGAIWNIDGENTYPYLQAKHMNLKNGDDIDLSIEENFVNFIKNKDEDHFEYKESWYRWSYQHQNIEIIKEKLISCFEKYPENVLFLEENLSEKEFNKGKFEIEDIKVKERGDGGVITVLNIDTSIGDFCIKNEYYIRSLLADNNGMVEMHDGKTYKTTSLLPSAFFIIETQKDDGVVSGLRLTGGGFGHGVGMSQNGAKCLANMNRNANEILSFYYPGCEVVNNYD